MVTRPRRQTSPFQKRSLLEEILPWKEHLEWICTLVPGENAKGWVSFKEDPNHFPGCPVLKGHWIFQALSEIAEIAIRSEPSLQEYTFLGFCMDDFLIRETVPIQKKLTLPVSAERIKTGLNHSSGKPLQRGKIIATLFTEDGTKTLASIIFNFKLKKFSF